MKANIWITALLAALALPAGAQSGEEAFEPVDIIALPSAGPESAPKRSQIAWECDSLMLSKPQRYRPWACNDEDQQQAKRELEVLEIETIRAESGS